MNDLTEKTSDEKLIDLLREELIQKIDLTREWSDQEVIDQIDLLILSYAKNHLISISKSQEMSKKIFNSIRRLDILQELFEDPTITEIMVNGPNQIFVEREGALTLTDYRFSSMEKYIEVIQQIVSWTNRMVNESNPITDTRLKDGSRVNVVMKPIALDGPILTIRRFSKKPFTIQTMIKNETLSEEVGQFLEKLVKAKYNIFLSGGTGSGKTTMLNVLSNFIPSDERIITIEDSAELSLTGVDNLVRMEARNKSVEGEGEITIRDLIKTSLRMRPDRIIVGEVRGGECLDMLQALNCGHSGSLSTGHANSCEDMIKRLETMTLMGCDMPLEAIRSQIASGIDIMVHLSRMRDKTRKVVKIVELLGYESGTFQVNELYRFVEEHGSKKVIGRWERINDLVCTEKLHLSGVSL